METVLNDDELCRLRELAELNHVATAYWDWYGNHVQVSADSLLKVLSALGLGIGPGARSDEIDRALESARELPWRQTLPPTVVVRQGASQEVPVHVPHGHWVNLKWVLEDGASGDCAQLDRWVEPQWIDGAQVGRATFQVPDFLPTGWHRLVATVEGGHVASATLIVVPQALTHPVLSGNRKRWGASVQMYSTRSHSSWGIGDATDLADILALCADRGADFLLINPVHASTPVAPLEDSPYLPVSRRWVNPIYIRPESIPEFSNLDLASLKNIEELRLTTQELGDSGDLIDRNRSWEAKRKALEIIFTVERPYHRESQFRHFVEEGGADLNHFALWCALIEINDGMKLPEDLSNVSSSQVDRLRLELSDRVEFWQWCQWVASEQLSHVQKVARDVGMDIGVMTDLAVGVHGQGSEVWSHPEYFAHGMSVGSPPDMYSQQGQNWSQPPWSPNALAQSGYAPLRHMVRAALANGGAVRIDHILGLFRLWWIPEGCPAGEGTYVYYDHEAMVGVVLLEAQRAGAVVVGEDLGVVEPWVRDYLKGRGILSTSVVWFEKDSGGWPMHPHEYREQCLAAVNIHDLPPTAGYLEGVQTTLRDQLGLLVEDVEQVRAADQVEREQTVARLREYGLITSATPTEREIVEALYAYIAKTPAKLVVASLVDAVGDKRPQNMPGTDSLKYPNWCIPLCDSDGDEVFVEDLPSHERLRSLFALLSGAVR